MKEKTYKTAKEACKKQLPGEAAIKTKKGYVNVKDFPPFKDPFKYNEIGLLIAISVGAIIGVCLYFNPIGVAITGLVTGYSHYWITYKRLN